jgi:hypothetical protein
MTAPGDARDDAQDDAREQTRDGPRAAGGEPMRAVERYTLVPADDATTSLLVRRDRLAAGGAGVAVDGVVLEAQLALADGRTLVCLTDDSPYEETLHVYLLGDDDAIEDALEAGAAWAAGILTIAATSDTWLELEFFRNDTIYRLDVEPSADVRLRLPRGWRYKSLLRTHVLAVRVARGGV